MLGITNAFGVDAAAVRGEAAALAAPTGMVVAAIGRRVDVRGSPLGERFPSCALKA